MSYAQIDSTIEDWLKANSLVLFTSWAGEQARFCYTSSPQGECVQISIEPPQGGSVRIHVWDVETAGDEEVHMEWLAPVPDLRQALDTALVAARKWFERHEP